MAGLEKKFYAPKNKGSQGPSPVSASGNGHFARWKVIRILDLGKLFFVESNFLEFFFVESGILDFGIQNPAQGVWNPANDWNPKSKFLRWFFPSWRGFSPVFPSRKNSTLPSFNSI